MRREGCTDCSLPFIALHGTHLTIYVFVHHRTHAGVAPHVFSGFDHVDDGENGEDDAHDTDGGADASHEGEGVE